MLQDIRIAFRFFSRAPAPTAIALLSIALSVGATAVVFAGIKSVLLDALPYAHPEQLVLVRSEYPRMQEQSSGDWVFWNDAQEIIRRTRTLESVGIYRNAIFDLAGDTSSPPEALYGLKVTASLFPTLGVSPMLGRNILPEEDQPRPRRRDDSELRPVGSPVPFGPGRGGPDRHGERPRLPGDWRDGARLQLPAAPRRGSHALALRRVLGAVVRASRRPIRAAQGVVARLRPGVSLTQARQDIGSIGDALAREFPATNRDHVLRLNFLRDRMLGGARNALLMLMAAALLFMLIGCSNVANLLLARGLARQREIAVRLAIGAGRGRIVRQLLTESCVLALARRPWRVCAHGGGVEDPAGRSAGEHSAAGRRARGFQRLRLCPGAGVINGILFGMAPALRLALGQSTALSGFGSRGAAAGGHDRMRSALVVAEVALSVVLVVIGGQLLGNFLRLVATDPGFQADRILASVVLPAPERYKDPEQRALFYRRILDSVRALPGVRERRNGGRAAF